MPSISVIRSQVESRIPGALSTYARSESEMLFTGIQAFDQKTGGIPRSALTQLCAHPEFSSGKTTLLLSLMAAVTSRQEFCALVDATDSFDPVSAETAGVDLSHLLWIRCANQQSESKRGKHRSRKSLTQMEQAFKAADIIVQNGGFGLIAVDLGNIEERLVRKVPLSTWFRFARVMEKLPAALVFLLACPAAQSCAALTLHLSGTEASWQETRHGSHVQLLSALECEIATGSSRMRKTVQSVPSHFSASTRWA